MKKTHYVFAVTLLILILAGCQVVPDESPGGISIGVVTPTAAAQPTSAALELSLVTPTAVTVEPATIAASASATVASTVTASAAVVTATPTAADAVKIDVPHSEGYSLTYSASVWQYNAEPGQSISEGDFLTHKSIDGCSISIMVPFGLEGMDVTYANLTIGSIPWQTMTFGTDALKIYEIVGDDVFPGLILKGSGDVCAAAQKAVLATLVLPEGTALPTATAGTAEAAVTINSLEDTTCPMAPASRVTAGGKASTLQAVPLRISPDVSSDANIKLTLKEGSTLTIEDSTPVCVATDQGSMLFWLVSTTDASGEEYIGWVPEGQGTTYYLAPQ